MSSEYRADIDGLRAISVIAIVFYHAGFAGFSGGFAGVDIFFVISGYLIVRGIQQDIDAGRFSLRQFYERRIRRILPALIAMLVVTTILTCLIVFPSKLRLYVPGLIGSSLFASNIVFWRQTSYFAPSGDEMALLHTWSLGVEEQFYIFIPLIMMLIARHLPGWRGRILVWGTLLSFALAIVLTLTMPAAAFYLLPTRAWELLAGALAGLALVPPVRRKPARQALSLAGLVLIAASIVVIDTSLPFPGPTAALPVIGTMLVLAYGAESGLLRPILTNPAMRFLGRISYSLYLWHWPVMVFARLYGYIDHSTFEALLAIGFSILLGWWSWALIEQPFRDPERVKSRAVFPLAGLSLAVVFAGGVALYFADGWEGRFDKDDIPFEYYQDSSPNRARCHVDDGMPDPAGSCVLGRGTPRIAVWGDSHGVELSQALRERFGAVQTITYSACPPAIGFEVPIRPSCMEHNDAVLRYLTSSETIETVFVAAYYQPQMQLDGFTSGMLRSIAGLRAAGKRVVVVGPTPGGGRTNLPKLIARTGRKEMTRREYEVRQRETLQFLEMARRQGAAVWMPADAFCDEQRCRWTVGDKPILFDNHHPSMTGMRHFVDSMPDLPR